MDRKDTFMKLTLFYSTKKSKYPKIVTRMKFTDGVYHRVTCQFIDPVKAPAGIEKSPVNIIAEKNVDFSMRNRPYVSKADNTIRDSWYAYFKNYELGEPYVDHSCDCVVEDD